MPSVCVAGASIYVSIPGAHVKCQKDPMAQDKACWQEKAQVKWKYAIEN